MNNFAFCTITYGDKYIKFGDSLISQINKMGYHIFVLTSDASYYKQTDLLTPVQYDKSYFSFHEKRNIMRKCLEQYEVGMFLDSDFYIKNVNDLSILSDVQPGLHVFGNHGDLSHHFLNGDFGKFAPGCFRNGKYGNLGLSFLKEKNLEYEQFHHNGLVRGFLLHFLEGRWILRREEEKEKKFFDIWDILARFTDSIDLELGFREQVGAGEGSHMSIAAKNSNITTHNISPLMGFIQSHFIANYQEKLAGEKPWGAPG